MSHSDTLQIRIITSSFVVHPAVAKIKTSLQTEFLVTLRALVPGGFLSLVAFSIIIPNQTHCTDMGGPFGFACRGWSNLCQVVFFLQPHLQWGAVDAEIRVPSGENTELKHSPFKAWRRLVYSHTCYAYSQEFLPHFYLSLIHI